MSARRISRAELTGIARHSEIAAGDGAAGVAALLFYGGRLPLRCGKNSRLAETKIASLAASPPYHRLALPSQAKPSQK